MEVFMHIEVLIFAIGIPTAEFPLCCWFYWCKKALLHEDSETQNAYDKTWDFKHPEMPSLERDCDLPHFIVGRRYFLKLYLTVILQGNLDIKKENDHTTNNKPNPWILDEAAPVAFHISIELLHLDFQFRCVEDHNDSRKYFKFWGYNLVNWNATRVRMVWIEWTLGSAKTAIQEYWNCKKLQLR